nr:hypothetical protein [Pandoravirus massiliensis]
MEAFVSQHRQTEVSFFPMGFAKRQGAQKKNEAPRPKTRLFPLLCASGGALKSATNARSLKKRTHKNRRQKARGNALARTEAQRAGRTANRMHMHVRICAACILVEQIGWSIKKDVNDDFPAHFHFTREV